jgi:hypothetical protein
MGGDAGGRALAQPARYRAKRMSKAERIDILMQRGQQVLLF